MSDRGRSRWDIVSDVIRSWRGALATDNEFEDALSACAAEVLDNLDIPVDATEDREVRGIVTTKSPNAYEWDDKSVIAFIMEMRRQHDEYGWWWEGMIGDVRKVLDAAVKGAGND